MGRRIVIDILLLGLALLLLNLIYSHTLYEEDFRKYSPDLLRLRQSIPAGDIYYFGESSNTTFTPNDSTQKSISDLTAGFFPGLKLVNINKEATHAGIYRAWLHEFERAESYPRSLVITLNLRSFDAAWIHSELENSLRESLVLGAPYPALANRFLLSLQAFGVKTDRERQEDMLMTWKQEKLPLPEAFPYHTVRSWDDAMANGGYLLPDGNWDMKKIELACHYIKAYAFGLNEKNLRVRDLDAVKEWCEKHQVPLYLNLLSENVHHADSLVGKELVFLIRQNRDYLVNRYNRGNCTVVDNLDLVAPGDFIDQHWTTEHYVARGRMRIAKHLATELKKRFENNYLNYY